MRLGFLLHAALYVAFAAVAQKGGNFQITRT